MKREALDHTKMKRLCRRLNIPLYQGVGLLETLWHITAKQAPRGDIGKLSNEDIAIGLDYRENEDVLVDALVAAGWIEIHPEFRLVVHDWHDHADDALNMRMARARMFFHNGRPPKLTNLPSREREQAHQFYTSVATDRQNVATAGTRTGQSVATPWLPPPPPPPPPPEPHQYQNPTPPEPVATVALSATAAAVREGYPETGDDFIARLNDAIRKKVAGLNGKIKSEPTDALIAKAVRHCARSAPNQNSAGLYLRTVPQCVASWLTNGEPAEATQNPIFRPEDYGIPG